MTDHCDKRIESMHFLETKYRPLGKIKRKMKKMRNNKNRLSFYLVIGFSLLFVIIVLTDILCVDDTNHFDMDHTDRVLQVEENTKVWETPPPLDVHLNSDSLRLYSSTLDSKVVSRKESIGSSLVARQEEMQQLMMNISASMSKNPLVRQIQASRAEFRYKNRASLSIDTTLHQHRGHDAVWQPVNGTHHKFFVYSAFYDDREKYCHY